MDTLNLTHLLVRVLVEAEPRHGGFRVVVLVSDSCDSPFDRLTHRAMFADARDAEKFADRVRSAKWLNLSNWFWIASAATSFAALQAPSKCVLETTPLASSFPSYAFD